MRLRLMGQMAKGLVNVNEHNLTSVQELLTEGDEGAEADEELDRSALVKNSSA